MVEDLRNFTSNIENEENWFSLLAAEHESQVNSKLEKTPKYVSSVII